MPFLTGYDKRKPIRYGSVRPTANLTGFNVAIDIADDADIAGELTGAGNFIRITEADGTTEVPFEIKNPVTAEFTAQIYAKFDLVSSASENDIIGYIYYDADGSSGADPTNAWNADYLAVYHAEDDPFPGSDPVESIKDSTVNASHADSWSVITANQIAAKLGGGYQHDANEVRWVTPFQSSDLTIGTLSVVVQHGNNAIGQSVAMGRSATNGLYFLNFGGTIYAGWYSGSEHRVQVAASGANWDDAAFQIYHLKWTDGGDTKLFRNGVQLGSTVSGTVVPSGITSLLSIGSDNVLTTFTEDSIFDEVRLSSVSRADAWITFEAANIIANGTTVTLGAEELADATVPGITSAVALSNTSVQVSSTSAETDGPFDYQFQRAPDTAGVAGTYADVGSAQNNITEGTPPTPITDTTTANTWYWYRCKVTNNSAGESFTAGVRVLSRFGTTYYVSTAGSDAANGTTTGTSWQTIDKVNTWGLVGGDTVLFNGGDTFTDSLEIAPLIAPGVSSRITIGTYGTGQAIIDPSNSYGIRVLNAGYVTIEGDLLIEGPGLTLTSSYPTLDSATTSTEAGILIEVNTVAVIYRGIIINGVEITGCKYGIAFIASDPDATEAHRDFEITDCHIHDCAIAGILLRGQGTAELNEHFHFGMLYHDGVITGNWIHEIPGLTDYEWGLEGGGIIQTGFGIFMLNCQGVLFENNLVHECGEASYPTAPGGPANILLVECTSCIVRSNETFLCYAPNGGGDDGIGIDLDLSCVNCIVERNWIYNCEGAGIMVFHAGAGGWQGHSGSVIRYNVIQNCGTKWDNYGIRVESPCKVYHNTFYNDLGPGNTSTGMIKVTGANAEFYNNIFAIGGAGSTFGVGQATTVLNGNCYYTFDSAAFSLTLNAVEYESLAELQAADFEMDGATPTGASGDPLFDDPGTGTNKLLAAAVSTLTNYDIAGGSAASGCGVDLSGFGITPPTTDWHGTTIPAGQFDAGASLLVLGEVVTPGTLALTLTTYAPDVQYPFSDSFTGTLGTLLDEHTSDSGHTWQFLAGGEQELYLNGTGKLYGPSTTPGGRTWALTSRVNDDADQYIEYTHYQPTNGDQTVGLLLRATTALNNVSDLNGYAMWHESDWFIRLLKYVNGTGSVLASITGPEHVNGDVTTFEVTGSGPVLLTARVNGQVILQYTDSTSPHTAAGSAGLMYLNNEAGGPSSGHQIDLLEHGDFVVDNSVTVIPGRAILALTTYAPDVTSSQIITPGTASLTITMHPPDVVAGGELVVTPGPITLTLTTYAPTLGGVTSNGWAYCAFAGNTGHVAFDSQL